MRRRLFVQAAAGAAWAAAAPAWAQTGSPGRAVTMVVPFAPGGGGDLVARLLARHLAERLGSPVVVENKAGASGNIGAAAVMSAAPDGHTLLSLSSTYAIQAAVGKPSFDPVGGMQPIVQVVREPLVLVAHPASPWRDAKALAQAAARAPGTISHGSAGPGSIAHMGMEDLAWRMGVKLLHVPYKGSAAAMTDLLGQNIQLVATTVTFATPFIRSGKVRALGIAGMQRLASLPEVPTFAEQGWPAYQVFDWKAVAGPKGMPQETVARLNREINAVLRQPSVAEKLESEGASVVGGTPEQLMQVVRADIERWRMLVDKAGVRIE